MAEVFPELASGTTDNLFDDHNDMADEYLLTDVDDILGQLCIAYWAPQIDEADIQAFETPESRMSLLAKKLRGTVEFSPTIEGNPEASLSFAEESRIYLSKLAIERPDYYKELEGYCGELLEQGSDRPDMTVCMAVASHQEAESIYPGLKLYADQHPDSGYELVLFLNRPEYDATGAPTSGDAVQSEVDRFKSDYPEVPIKLMERTYPDDAGLGVLKGALHDAVTLLHAKRETENPLYILNDIDGVHIDSDYLQTVQSLFKNAPSLDAYAGALDLDPATLATHPALLASMRSYQYINALLAAQTDCHIMAGGNCAVRAAAYCAVGGSALVATGEDVVLGMTLHTMRGGSHRIAVTADPKLLVVSSARRAHYAFMQGYAANEKWRLPQTAYDDEVRVSNNGGKRFELPGPQGQAALTDTVERILQQTLQVYEDDTPSGLGALHYRKALGNLGLAYTVERGYDGESLRLRRPMGNFLRAFRLYENELHR